MVLSADVGLRFRGLGDQFARPPGLLVSATGRVRRAGVVRAAGRAAADWVRGLWAAPGAVGQRVGSQLSAVPRVIEHGQEGGHRAARRELERSLAAERGRVGASVIGAAGLADRLLRFTAIGPALLVGDACNQGVQATLEQHTYDAVQLGPDLLASGSASAVVRLHRISALEKAADARWVASGPDAAQGARLAEDLARQEAWGLSSQPRLIAGPGGAAFRDAIWWAASHGGAAEDWVKLAGQPYRTPDGRIMETHWVQNMVTGRRYAPKEKAVAGVADG